MAGRIDGSIPASHDPDHTVAFGCGGFGVLQFTVAHSTGQSHFGIEQPQRKRGGTAGCGDSAQSDCNRVEHDFNESFHGFSPWFLDFSVSKDYTGEYSRIFDENKVQ
jgi:hypothetical protein